MVALATEVYKQRRRLLLMLLTVHSDGYGGGKDQGRPDTFLQAKN
jgi:hypothetical protein